MAVIDSSSLILLGKIRRLRLIKDLFNEIIITKHVFDEVGEKPQSEEFLAIKKAIDDEWIKVKKCEGITSSLNKGEASSISIALKEKSILITDDMRAIVTAEQLGIEAHGTLYIILECLKKGKIENKEKAKKILGELVINGLYISSDLIADFYERLDKLQNL